MGFDYRCELFVGVPASELYEIKTEKLFEKKFNENTGEPYQREIIAKQHLWLGKEVPKNREEDVEYLAESIGLQYIVSYSESVLEETYVGLVIVQRDDLGESRTSIADIEVAKKQVDEILKNHGLAIASDVYLALGGG